MRRLCGIAGSAWGALLVSLDNERWIVCSWGEGGPDLDLLPRDRVRILQAGLAPFPLGVSSADGPEGGDEKPTFAFPVRLRGEMAGFGLLGGFVDAPLSDTLLTAIEAAARTIGVSFEGAAAGSRAADRLRLSRKFDFLVRLNGRRHAPDDFDGLFRWVCRELPKVVPVAAVEMATLRAGLPGGAQDPSRPVGEGERGRRAGGAEKAAAMLARHGTRVFSAEYRAKTLRPPSSSRGLARHRRFPIRWRWESALRCGGKTHGVMAVHLAAAPRCGSTWPLLGAVADHFGRALQGIADRERIRSLALHDCLTGLFNYRAFQDLFEREFARYSRHGRNLSLVIFDLDNFKSINDTFGHRVGDEVLRKVAKIILRNLRKTDYAFRYGGDEFVVLMAEIDAGRAAVFADRVLSAFRREIRGLSSLRFSLSASAGIADCTALTTQQSEELLLRADGALYQAKYEGRNRIRIACGARSDEPAPEGSAAIASPPARRLLPAASAVAVI